MIIDQSLFFKAVQNLFSGLGSAAGKKVFDEVRNECDFFWLADVKHVYRGGRCQVPSFSSYEL